jgi:hypothetical protein
MNFNKHSELDGKHAILSPSKPYWLNYSQEQIANYLRAQRAAQEGTELHEIAASLIRKGLKLRGSTQTLAAYVNDAIGYGMTPEVALKYSDVCFGHADAVDFSRGVLRIHDLKTGSGPVHMEQLEIYAALFLLEYERALGVNPLNTKVNLRIYQNDDIQEYAPDKDRMEALIYGIKERDAWVQDSMREEIGR